jgi:hypothetical protein
MVLSGRRRGACDALRWQDDLRAYRCGAMIDPEAVLRQAPAPWLRGLAPVLGPVLKRLARRWIAAGTGCDSSLEVEMTPQSDRQLVK